MLGKNFITTLTDEKKRGYENGRIDYTFLKKKDNFKHTSMFVVHHNL
jgi:hypothetical protein